VVVVGFLIKQIRGYFGPATSVEQGRYRVRTYSCFRGQIHRLSVRLRQVISPEKSIAQAIAAEDEIRPESKEAIDELHSLGVRVAMITGDSKMVADSVAIRLGIDEVAAEVLPADKAAAVQRFLAGIRWRFEFVNGFHDTANARRP
jgi:cation transport ATPase